MELWSGFIVLNIRENGNLCKPQKNTVIMMQMVCADHSIQACIKLSCSSNPCSELMKIYTVGTDSEKEICIITLQTVNLSSKVVTA